MRQWLEEDQDEQAKREKDNREEFARMNKKEHEQWVKSKDSLRIRLPSRKDLSTVLPKHETRMKYDSIFNIRYPLRYLHYF